MIGAEENETKQTTVRGGAGPRRVQLAWPSQKKTASRGGAMHTDTTKMDKSMGKVDQHAHRDGRSTVLSQFHVRHLGPVPTPPASSGGMAGYHAQTLGHRQRKQAISKFSTSQCDVRDKARDDTPVPPISLIGPTQSCATVGDPPFSLQPMAQRVPLEMVLRRKLSPLFLGGAP
ncbi:hypothetical protein GGTG_02367 [Gaeumannomyces tritici R3-111a-1]|uniref:Uncharacterized protein n=1 Tax=Gaeumannomyces tritici (strain R3-111a-1) TaxID=644352 RepID=J3NM63_GAET3|nr:hypothetical protein GGTG_02367 [Gaeumannomyces tritici R3-111a-1]EJT82394.1 hypothetical protein GGTG_02367 [Gaeumannomyces tritici R3-111a-1]